MQNTETGTFFTYGTYLAMRGLDDSVWTVSGIEVNADGSMTLRHAPAFPHRWQVIEYVDAQARV